MIRAKFVVDHVTRSLREPAAEVSTVVLKPVRGAGEIQIDASRAEVAEQFVLGAEYYVDFTRAS